MSLSIFIASFLLTSANPKTIDWLKPLGQFRLRYEENRQKNMDESGLELDLRFGVFPEIVEDSELGIELRVAETQLGSDPARVSLDSGFSSKNLAISQAYLAYRLRLSDSTQANLGMGKFMMPVRTSPVTWYDELSPEGLSGEIQWQLPSNHLILTTQHLQLSADRVSPSITASTPVRRSWLFVNSLGAEWTSGMNFKMTGNFTSFYLLDPSERLRELSVERGNTIQTGSVLTKEKFAPLELNLDILTSQFGFEAEFKGAAALNLASKEHDRSFYVGARVGNQKKKGAYSAKIEYLYSEPNTQFGAFLNPDWGYTNRKGPRFGLWYFPSKRSVLKASLGLFKRLESNLVQADLITAFLEFKRSF